VTGQSRGTFNKNGLGVLPKSNTFPYLQHYKDSVCPKRYHKFVSESMIILSSRSPSYRASFIGGDRIPTHDQYSGLFLRFLLPNDFTNMSDANHDDLKPLQPYGDKRAFASWAITR
jgi:hypothetical protein